jgi:hypothetical protein
VRSLLDRLREIVRRRRRQARRRRAIDRILELRRTAKPASDEEIARLREEVRRDAGL